ncbi:hypothetical protein EMPS_10350 [Entomortierella parvispora]|uniref:Monopolin complex subunit Csm1/Pcs1 C-terminal domain-containing protein n=1 Tax=Entomortierella parvispora TaxID=205924 RepID=A0A9P3HJX5_9FUNG|nr:hypothetical protein EMPS_10350 [Entomortierella parvispora]
MPPKRSTGSKISVAAVKRTKSTSESYSSLGSRHAERPSKTVRRDASPVPSNSENEEQEQETLIKKKSQPKPRKKSSQQESSSLKRSNDPNGSTNNSYAVTESSSSNDQQKQKRIRNMMDMSKEEVIAAMQDVQGRFKFLKQLRHTEAETHLGECRAKLEEVTESAENYRRQIEPQLQSALQSQQVLRDINETLNAKVRTLERELRDARKKLEQKEREERIKTKDASIVSVLASPDVTPRSAITISTLHMFENLSGFKITPKDISSRSAKERVPSIWDCEHTGKRGTLRFTLTYSTTSSLVTYSPKIDSKKDAELLQFLPNYLTVDIEFEKEYESKFFWRILNFTNEQA